MDVLCFPAKVYLILAITGMILSLYNKLSLSYYFFGTLFIILWTTLLNWFCNKGFVFVSWFLVMLPVISSFVIAGMYISMLAKKV
jgi:hypothetical protein